MAGDETAGCRLEGREGAFAILRLEERFAESSGRSIVGTDGAEIETCENEGIDCVLLGVSRLDGRE